MLSTVSNKKSGAYAGGDHGSRVQRYRRTPCQPQPGCLLPLETPAITQFRLVDDDRRPSGERNGCNLNATILHKRNRAVAARYNLQPVFLNTATGPTGTKIRKGVNINFNRGSSKEM
jgi:hypothetical protein